MSLVSRVSAVLNGVGQTTWQAAQLRLAASATGESVVQWPDHYALLRAHYLMNGLYLAVSQSYQAQGLWQPAMQNLRSPAYSVVEFHASKVWPELPEVQTENAAILAPIAQLWAWSNWAHRRQIFIRWLAMYGDALIKVVQRPHERAAERRVYFQLIEPQYCTDLDLDERGYVTYIRLDQPVDVREGDKTVRRRHTEVWDKRTQQYRRWEHDKAADTALERLGPPADVQPFAAFGVDFVPFVAARFRDIGEKRGISAFLPAIDLIDEANRVCTRLHQLAFRYGGGTWALEGTGTDSGGRPLAPPRVAGNPTGDAGAGDAITIRDEQLWRLPSGWKLASLVPQLPYEQLLNILNAHLRQLEQVLPEMAYYRLRDFGTQLSGRAAKVLLSDAQDRVLEARANAEDALARADAMGLTMGAWMRLPQFGTLGGDFGSGAFAHTFKPQDVLPADPLEEAQTDQAKAEAASTKLATGAWSQTRVLTDYGYSEAEIEEMQTQRTTQDVIPLDEERIDGRTV